MRAAAPLITFSAPAAERPAGASPQRPTDAVLPDGRIAAPLGASIFVGTDPQAVAAAPDGRYVVVANAEQHPTVSTPPASSPAIVAGYSLAVVDARAMRVVSVYHDPSLTVFRGLAIVRDPNDAAREIVLASDGAHNAVRVFDLDAGGTLNPQPTITVGGYPDTIALAPNGRTAYVASNIGNRVTAIDLSTGRTIGDAQTGYFPAGVAASGSRLYVVNSGLSTYGALDQPTRAPRFANPQVDQLLASSLSAFALQTGGTIDTNAVLANVPMDPIPDGAENVGGAHPGALVVRRRGDYAYVTMANVDRVATISLRGDPHVVAGLDLRFYNDSPYGTQPSAEVLSRDDARLYVALAGLNAIAVLDARHGEQLHRLGLIPTGSYPTALALSPDGRYLFATAAKGVDGWGELQRIDLRHLPLGPAMYSALRYNRVEGKLRPNLVVPALLTRKRSNVIDHVVYIAIGTENYDAIFGDLGIGNGDPNYVTDGAAVTPNLHALARAYAIADNFYALDTSVDLNLLASLAGEPSLYAQQVAHVSAGRAPLDDRGDDPEDYPRAGYLFNALARSGLSYRDYGGMLALSGYRVTAVQGHGRGRTDVGAGGTYTLDVPALAALDGNVDLDYPGWNPAVPDSTRVDEFVSDMGRLVQADEEPSFTYLWLPATASGGIGAADRALGRAIAFLSRTPHWSSTAVFIVGEGVESPRDHVNGARSFALVVSPLAKPGYVGKAHLSVASVVKTEEELLGLSPLSLGDLLSTDMADFFGQAPYPSTYQAIP